jgi:hypothetical protein
LPHRKGRPATGSCRSGPGHRRVRTSAVPYVARPRVTGERALDGSGRGALTRCVGMHRCGRRLGVSIHRSSVGRQRWCPTVGVHVFPYCAGRRGSFRWERRPCAGSPWPCSPQRARVKVAPAQSSAAPTVRELMQGMQASGREPPPAGRAEVSADGAGLARLHRVPPRMPRPSGRGGIGLLRSRAGIAGSPSGRSGVHPSRR